MSNDNIQSMIQAIASGDNVGAQKTFESDIGDRISSAIDARKADVAKSMFDSVEVVADEDV